MARRPGLAIDPDAVREARVAAGLTQAELARGHLTKQALSLIELGRARPSLDTLQLIAARTDRPLSDFLLEPLPAEPGGAGAEVEMAELERLASLDDHEATLLLGRRLLQLSIGRRGLARVRLLMGRALVRLYQPDAALEHLRKARQAFHTLPDLWLEVECMNYLAGALHQKEDAGAIPLAEEALDLCRRLSPRPVDTELRLLVNLANFHSGRHEWEQAVARSHEALGCADEIQDLSRLARLNYTLAVAYRNLGDAAQALACAQRALALQRFERDGAQEARVQNTLGLLRLQQGDLEGAERSLYRSLEGYRGTCVETGVSHVLMSLAELHIARCDHVAAERVLDEAVARFESSGERMSAALGRQLLGTALDGQGRRAEADQAFAAALAQLEELAVPERLVECHAAYASVLDGRGDVEAARDHWRQAALTRRPELAPPASAPGREATA